MAHDGSTTFGKLLRDFRLAAGMSQEALAERARMSAAGISVLERGVRRVPYRDTVELLAQALGLSAEDRRLLEDSAVRRPQPRRRQDTGVADSLEPVAHNLPIELTSFIGRDAELAQIRALLDGSRLVTIVGPGGVGKTRIALRIAEMFIGRVDAGVWFVDLAPLADPSFVAATIANALGVAQAPNRSAQDALIPFLAHRKLLMVLDNCEHVLAEAARVTEAILRTSAGVRVLATSREPLKAAGERVYRLPPLPSADAVALFVGRAEAVDHRFVPGERSAQLVGDLCERLDGIPLAIELAAARTGTLPLKTLVEKLDQRLSILADAGHHASTRHQTLRAMIDWSYALLPAPAQHLFEQLSIFAGGTTLATAIRVSDTHEGDEDEMLETLTSLVDKSLVVPDFDHEEPRYTLLDSMRHYGKEQLERRGDRAATARRHALAYLDLAEHYEAEWDTAPHPAWRDVLLTEMDNWRAALEWALVSRQDVALGLRLVGALHGAWLGVALGDSRRWLRLARDLVDEDTPRDIVAQLDHIQAQLAQRAAEAHVALEFGERALQAFRELHNVRRAIGSQRIVADALMTLGRVDEARVVIDDALAMARAGGYRLSEAFLLQSLGRDGMLAGNLEDARAHFHASLAILRELGDELSATMTAVNLAEVEFYSGDAAAALRLAEEGFTHRSRRGIARLGSLPNKTAYLVALDRFDNAVAHGREVLQLARYEQDNVGFSWALQHVAAAALLRLETGAERSIEIGRAVARVLGFVDARITSAGARREYTEQQEYDRLIPRLRATLSDGELAREMAVGAMLDEDAVLDVAGALAGSPAPEAAF